MVSGGLGVVYSKVTASMFDGASHYFSSGGCLVLYYFYSCGLSIWGARTSCSCRDILEGLELP